REPGELRVQERKVHRDARGLGHAADLEEVVVADDQLEVDVELPIEFRGRRSRFVEAPRGVKGNVRLRKRIEKLRREQMAERKDLEEAVGSKPIRIGE